MKKHRTADRNQYIAQRINDRGVEKIHAPKSHNTKKNGAEHQNITRDHPRIQIFPNPAVIMMQGTFF